ncbi:MAG: flagellar motor switch protein FliG [Alphaproteobacteria bacterium]|nr:flagellar motor switch protein FliG [Alphaproteobacteria bacterium]
MAGQQAREGNKPLTGVEKAAILLMAIGEENASSLFEKMDDDEIREISQTMAHLGTIDSDLVERLFVEFADLISNTSSLVGTYESTERLLQNVLPGTRVESIMEEIRGPAGRTMWDKLANVNEQMLANYLKNEYPQTVAVVLSKIRPDHAAPVLALLPESFAMEVIMRMLRMESVQREILDDVENTLRTEFMSNLARTNRRDAHELMAEIFNGFDRGTEARFMEALEERNKESAEKIKQLMFTFEDLATLDPGSIQTLLSKVDNARLALALKGASDPLKDLFLSNMSTRAAKFLQDEMSDMGPVRLRDVDEAQTELVNVAKSLAAAGEIVILDNKDDDELIY